MKTDHVVVGLLLLLDLLDGLLGGGGISSSGGGGRGGRSGGSSSRGNGGQLGGTGGDDLVEVLAVELGDEGVESSGVGFNSGEKRALVPPLALFFRCCCLPDGGEDGLDIGGGRAGVSTDSAQHIPAKKVGQGPFARNGRDSRGDVLHFELDLC